MYVVTISVFALVLAAASSVAVALLISRAALHQRLLTALGDRCSKLSDDVKVTANATLKAEVDDLRGALDRVAASNRKEFGSLWGRLGGRAAAGTDHTGRAIMPEDDELEAYLQLQNARPVQPQ